MAFFVNDNPELNLNKNEAAKIFKTLREWLLNPNSRYSIDLTDNAKLVIQNDEDSATEDENEMQEIDEMQEDENNLNVNESISW